MPVRSLTQSVWRWPTPEQVLEQVQAWAVEQKQNEPGLQQMQVILLAVALDQLFGMGRAEQLSFLGTAVATGRCFRDGHP